MILAVIQDLQSWESAPESAAGVPQLRQRTARLWELQTAERVSLTRAGQGGIGKRAEDRGGVDALIGVATVGRDLGARRRCGCHVENK